MGIVVGSGEADPFVVSASLDQTVRVWSVASGTCVQTLLFPAAIHCVALHWTEGCVFAGAADGRIFQAAVSRQDAAAGSRSATPPAATEHATMSGHTQAITCLALATDGLLLVSGSRDGSVRVWDTATQQMLQMLQQPCHAPVTALLVRVRPPYLHATGARSNRADTASQSLAKPARPLPLAHFAKYPGSSTATKAWEDAVLLLDGSQAYGNVIERSGLLAFCERGAAAAAGAAEDDNAEARVAALEAELSEYKRKYAELVAAGR